MNETVLLYIHLYSPRKAAAENTKQKKNFTNYSLCTVRQFVLSHKTILTVIIITLAISLPSHVLHQKYINKTDSVKICRKYALT